MAEFRILIPLDGSPLAEQSLSYLSAVMHFDGAELLLLSVVDESEDFGVLTSQEATDRELNVLTTYLSELRRDIQQRLKLDVQTKVVRGTAAASILDEAGEYHPDVIIISTHGRSGFSRWRFGSVADKVIRGTKNNVLVIGPRAAEQSDWRHVDLQAPFSSILVPLDGSALAEAALPLAERWAETFHAQLHLVRVVSMPAPSDGFESLFPYTPDLLDTILEQAKGYLSTCAGRLKSTIDTTVDVPVGPAALRLQDYAADKQIGLVIMTSHGRSGILRSALGSVTDRLLGGSAPVMVVPCFVPTEQ